MTKGICTSVCSEEGTASVRGYPAQPSNQTPTATSFVSVYDSFFCYYIMKSTIIISPPDDVYERGDIIGVYATTVALGLTIMLCGITAAFAFFNTFGTYRSWLYGPPMVYILSLVTGPFNSTV